MFNNLFKGLRISLAVGLTGLVFFGSLSLLEWLARYFPPPTQPPPNTDNFDKLTLLGNPFSGYSTFRNPEFKEKLKEAGLNFEFRNQPDQVKRFESLHKGEADLLVTSLDQFLIHRKGNEKIVGLIDRSVGADAVVLNNKNDKNLKSLNDLSDLLKREGQQKWTITFAENTPSEYLALVLSDDFPVLQPSNFKQDKVKESAEAWERLQNSNNQNSNNNVAVAVLWEPDITKAKNNEYEVLLSSYHLPYTIIDVVVASDDLINSQPQKIVELLKKYYAHIDSSLESCSKLKEQIENDVKGSGLFPANVTKLLEGIYFFSSVEAKEWMTNKKLEERIKHTAGVLKRKNKLHNELSRDLFTNQFIQEVVTNNKHPSGKNCIYTPSSRTERTIGDLAGENIEYEGQKYIPFNSGSSQLTDKGRDRLDEIAQKIAEYNPEAITVKVIGHTSKTGNLDPTFNQQLSLNRAEAVKNYLKNFKDELGVKLAHEIEPAGEGYNKSIEGTRPENERNQRTEILLQIVKK